MSSRTRKKAFAIFFVALTLAIPFGMIYYVSTDFYKERYQEWRRKSDNAGMEARSRQMRDQVILRKDKELTVKRTSLIYRGYDKTFIFIDLYLLDLDPEQPYRQKIPRQETDKDLVIGGNKYRLISLNKSYLALKLITSSQIR